jgi:hypothetical protein
MNLRIEFREPTDSFCDLAFFLNGLYIGQLSLAALTLPPFLRMLATGCRTTADTLIFAGDPEQTDAALICTECGHVRGIHCPRGSGGCLALMADRQLCWCSQYQNVSDGSHREDTP